MHRGCVSLALLLWLSAGSPSVAAEGERLSLDAFIARVLAESPRVRAVAARVAQAQADVDASGLWPNPGVRIERQSGPLLEQTRGSQDFLLVEVPVVISGRLSVEREAATARAFAADLDAQEQVAGLHREAVEVYVEVVHAERRVHMLVDERTRLIKVVEVARRRAAAGESPPTTPLRLEVELARLDDDTRLARLAQEEAGQRAQALAGAALPPFSQDFPLLPPAPTVARERAGTRAWGRRVDAAKLDEDAAGRRLVPDVTVTAGPALLNTGATDFSVGYAVSLGVSLPIFDHGQGEAARARANRAGFDAEGDVVRGRSAAAVAVARRQAATASERASAYAGSVLPAAQTLFQAAVRSMELGSAEGDAAAVLVFVDAARTLREARTTLDDLRADTVRADATLTFVSGAWDGPEESRP